MTDVYEKFEQYVATVGLTETAFPSLDKYGTVRQPEAIFVQAPTTNTVSVWIGKAGTKADFTTGGLVLPVGGNTVLPFFNENLLVHIASAAGQKLLITYMKGKLR